MFHMKKDKKQIMIVIDLYSYDDRQRLMRAKE